MNKSEALRIENGKQAEWAMGNIREAKAEIEKWEELYTSKLGADLRRIWCYELTPFPERYPMLKRSSYEGKKK